MGSKEFLRRLGWFLIFAAIGVEGADNLRAEEVPDTTRTRVIVRNHPKTGRSYASIVASESPTPPDPLGHLASNYSRPDYRLLDPAARRGEIPYDGPVSDRKKVYIFAASLMTMGATGGAVGIATAPAATTVAATGGGAYVAGGSALAGGMAAAGVLSARSHPDEEYQQTSESKVIVEERDDSHAESREETPKKKEDW